jgi:hypothetical protein
MKRFIMVVALFAAALTLVASGAADPGKGKGKGSGKTEQAKGSSSTKGKGKFTYTVTTTDNGSCGNAWATDVVHRTFTVKQTGTNTFRVTRKDKGVFTTLAGQSPGACETTSHHGHLVQAGIKGKMRGYLTGTVTGTFNPNATCTGTSCGFTDTFISTFFGAAAVNTFTCFNGYAGCKFVFNYNSPDKSLKFHHWLDKGTNGVTEQFGGDIANS